MCIYEHTRKHGNIKQFWDYIRKVHAECDSNINEDCSKFAHKETGINWDKTVKCVKHSFNSTDWTNINTTNSMIDEDIAYWKLYGSGMFPSIVINNSTYRGQIETQAVMNAICAGFADPPKMCKRLLEDANIENDIGEGVLYFDNGYKAHHVVGLAFLYIVVIIFGLLCYRRYAKRKMKETMDI